MGAEKMSNNIVVLAGSPRKEGNTERLAATFIESAKSAGKNVTAFNSAGMKIGGCMGCEHCPQRHDARSSESNTTTVASRY